MSITAKYSFNGNANDLVSGNNGTSSGISWVGGINGGAKGDGSSAYITIPDNSVLDTGLQNMTISFNILTDEVGTSNKQIFLKGNSSGFNSWYFLFNNGLSGRCQFGMYDGSDKYSRSDVIPFNDGKYHRISITGNGTVFKIFKNGVESSSYSAQTTTPYTMQNTDRVLDILRDGKSNIYYSSALIDELIFRNNVISNAEIKNEYLFYNGFI